MTQGLVEPNYVGWPLTLVEQECRQRGVTFTVVWTAADRGSIDPSSAEGFVVRQHMSAEGIYQFIAVWKKRKEVQKVSYKINDGCVACGTCAATCPVGAIKEGSPIYVISESECIECGACASVCPVSAIEAP